MRTGALAVGILGLAACSELVEVRPAPTDAGPELEAAAPEAAVEAGADVSIAQSCTPYEPFDCDGGFPFRCYGGDLPPGDVGVCEVVARTQYSTDSCCERLACLRRYDWSCNPADGGVRQGWWCPGITAKPPRKGCKADHDAGASASGLDYCCDP